MFVAYEIETTLLVTTKSYATYSAAKAALTRYINKHSSQGANGYAIAEAGKFHNEIEKKVKRTNALSGKTFYEAANTPFRSSPSSESYWSA
jgi:predicted HD phosphohydrolase